MPGSPRRVPAAPRPRALRRFALGLAGALCACAPVRELVVESDPPGAAVRLDGEYLGETPLVYPFEHFGVRRMTLYREGYRTTARLVALEAPWQARFPWDLFTEVLVPVGYRYVHRERIALEAEVGEVRRPDVEPVLARAERLRRGGVTGPRPDLPAPGPAQASHGDVGLDNVHTGQRSSATQQSIPAGQLSPRSPGSVMRRNAMAGPIGSIAGAPNNGIGVPLSLLSLRRDDDYAVIEMGANHPGEIDRLSRLARPDVAVINNASSAHLAGFGNLKAVARAKGEIIAGLPADGRVVINHDDPCVGVWWQLAADHQQIGFAIGADADVRAEEVRGRGLEGSRFILSTATASCEVDLPLPGEHNVANALAAAAAALALGIQLPDVAAGLADVRGVRGRLQLVPLGNGVLGIDDTYNANPRSLSAALKVLTSSGRRRLWLVLGDMAELGVCSESFHVKAGHEARAQLVERLYAVGELSRLAAEAFGEGGTSYPDRESLVAALRADTAGIESGDLAILFKGSRSAGMEMVLQALRVLGASGQRAPGWQQGLGD